MRKISFLIASVFVLLCVNSFLFSCTDDKRNKSHASTPLENIEVGEVLAKKYCQSCHLLPDPSLANSKSWEEGILPHMGPYLGIFQYGFENYPSGKNDTLLPRSFYPSKQLISFVEWQYIIDYYTSVSPDSLLPTSNQKKIREDLSLFKAEESSLKIFEPSTSLVKIYKNEIITADLDSKKIFRFDKELQLIDSFYAGGAVVDMQRNKNDYVFCYVGNINPNNGQYGRLQYVKEKSASLIVDSLRRPVQFTSADLNGDKRTDYIVCEFGFQLGNLSWLEQLNNGKFKKHVIKPIAGAVQVMVDDYNKDGLLDLWVLFAQGNEGIFLFTNRGSGQFKEEQVLQFPSIYGSTSFDLMDVNGDGLKDIVYTCGDNADYSRVLKPYHGVYLYLNNGNNKFKQAFFYPINGCYKALARDFDDDGDLDIATISFFADYVHRPEEGFIYFENKGDFNFVPFSLKEAQRGRWLTMDAGDIDGDKKLDLVLGNFTYGPAMMHSSFDWKKGPAILVLKNIGNNQAKKTLR